MKKNAHCKQNGVILPVVLIFFSVLMLLGITFVSVGGFQITQSRSQVERSKLYYVAKSGADTFAEYLVDLPDTYKEVYPDTYNETTMSFIDGIIGKGFIEMELENFEYDGKLEIRVDSVSADTITILSKATREKHAAEVSVNLHYRKSGSIKVSGDNTVILIDNEYSTGIVHPPSGQHQYISEEDVIEKTKMDYPVVENFPEGEMTGNLTAGSVNIDQNAFYDTIDIDKKDTLTININNFINKDDSVYIAVRTLIVDGSIRINNPHNKKIYLFVREHLMMAENGKPEIVNDDSNNFVLMYNGSDHIISENNSIDFTGVLYAPNAGAALKNQSDFTGVAIVDSFKINNNAVFTGVLAANSIQYLNNGIVRSEGISAEIPSDLIDDELSDLVIEFNSNPWE